MRHIPREKSDPFTDFAKMMKHQGYNKDVKLTFGTVVSVDAATVKVKLDGNHLETTSLVPLGHLLPAYYPAHIVFSDELGAREASIMIDNPLETGDRVMVVYDDTGDKLFGFILDKEG